MKAKNTEDLCLIAELLGYKYGLHSPQMSCENGSNISSLLNLIDDNPDLVEVIQNWVAENIDEEFDPSIEEEEEEDFDDNEDE